MKTIIVNVPDEDATLFLSLVKKFRFKTKVLSKEDLEDEELAKWINNGMKSEDVSEKDIYKIFRKNGIKV